MNIYNSFQLIWGIVYKKMQWAALQRRSSPFVCESN